MGNFGISLYRHLRTDRAGNIVVHMTLSMLLLNISYVATTLSWRLAVGACAFVTAATHYFLLATLLWALVQVYSLYEMLVKVFITYESHFLLKRCLFAWGAWNYVVKRVFSVVSCVTLHYGLI